VGIVLSTKVETPVTLADKLKMQSGGKSGSFPLIALLSLIMGLLLWWVFASLLFGVAALIVCALGLIAITPAGNWKGHFLVSGDQQGFMKNLKLSEKTAIFDGSNIYHFGLENGFGKKALEILIHELRSDGFRVVCFFDANIYFTLRENGEYQNGTEKFSTNILQRIFGLKETEIYVVPSGIQADRFILESLSLLPVSFAVTNDRYRDYEAKYDFLTKDFQWRKGVKISEGNLLLYQHNFKKPLVM
jgi:hypothetical protein